MRFVIWIGLFLVACLFVYGLIWIREKNFDRQYPRTIGCHDEWD